jgi:hypothetical protein
VSALYILQFFLFSFRCEVWGGGGFGGKTATPERDQKSLTLLNKFCVLLALKHVWLSGEVLILTEESAVDLGSCLR